MPHLGRWSVLRMLLVAAEVAVEEAHDSALAAQKLEWGRVRMAVVFFAVPFAGGRARLVLAKCRT